MVEDEDSLSLTWTFFADDVAEEAGDSGAGAFIAAWRMDNPDDALVYDQIFDRYVVKLNDAFYEEKRRAAERLKQDLLTFLVDGGRGLGADAQARAEQALLALETDFGYCRPCAVEVVGFALKQEQLRSTEEE